MVVAGVLAGLATGGPPAVFAQAVSTAALLFAMTMSLTEVRFLGVSVRSEVRSFARAALLNYGVLSGLILSLAFLYEDPVIRNGWIVMAAVPSAIAIIPITSLFGGNVQRTLVSSALLYAAAFALTPLITLTFAGRATSVWDIGVQLVILLAIPMVLSRFLRRSGSILRHRAALVNLSFFVLVLALTGANRDVLFGNPSLAAVLVFGGFVRTWVVGVAVYVASSRTSDDRSLHLADTLFATLKNLGLAALLGLSLFGPSAALPAIVCMFVEITWVVALGRWFA
jgi:BASS family bile acid:Na+ symporter